ncbi:Translation initiation factor IF-2 [Amphibalanus amphitrite]|uniref:Translation initiation factor IF-2 n=1 Tax=Amphibalanus amphitrite TaxID=1232801 RepID=A0A6A4VFU8_AMPAM|nr:Translation initiation factor IF-2 [Amphibalanus amphitrite]
MVRCAPRARLLLLAGLLSAAAAPGRAALTDVFQLPSQTFQLVAPQWLWAGHGFVNDTAAVYWTGVTGSLCDCTTRCFVDVGCLSLSYDTSSGACQLNAVRGHPSNTEHRSGTLHRLRPQMVCAGSRTAGSRTAGSRTTGHAGHRTAGSRTAGSRTAGSRTTGSRTAGSRTAGHAGHRTAGSRTAGSRTAGSRTTGSRTAGHRTRHTAGCTTGCLVTQEQTAPVIFTFAPEEAFIYLNLFSWAAHGWRAAKGSFKQLSHIVPPVNDGVFDDR